MNNIFQMSNQSLIREKFDLKGSKYKRFTNASEVIKGHAKKELNFEQENFSLNLNVEQKNRLINQLEKDSAFLAKNSIIDYSLLVGISKVKELEENNF